MNRILDEERWAPGRDAIEREKTAARAWLARRDEPVVPFARARKPRHRVGRRLRWIAAAFPVLVIAAILLVKWGDSSRSFKDAGPVSAFLKVLGDVQETGPALELEDIHFGPAGMTDFAWSIQQVLCRVRLTDETSKALAPLIEKALLKARAEEDSWRKPVLEESFRPTRFSLFFLRVYKSIWEG